MNNKKLRRNCGSAVIEITLLMPAFLGCIYLYIMLFLFFIDSGKRMEQLAECIYTTKQESVLEQSIVIRTEGNLKIGRIEAQDEPFVIQLELRKDENDPVKNIRRWQLVADVF